MNISLFRLQQTMTFYGLKKPIIMQYTYSNTKF